MKATELLKYLSDLVEKHGDLEVEIDHPNLYTTLSIDDIDIGDAYIGKDKYFYIYPDTNDIEKVLEYYTDKGYEQAKDRL